MISGPGDQIVLSGDREERTNEQAKRQGGLVAFVCPESVGADGHTNTAEMSIEVVCDWTKD